ncbi:DUF2946 family protein [Parasedimentitalea denitrificans]|uniref:DUF2946 family protein n=1 Tax=Parasedimentitalea denitrificans TaxID=2211118 RepID=UPI00197D709B|nr:DUF2946 family protein [Sedimentitalea sp. CY04]
MLSYLVLLAIMLAGLIPAGWMPASGSDGKVLLVICTTDGTQEQWVDLGGDTAPAEQMDDRSCPFTALTTAALIPDNIPALPVTSLLSDRWADEPFTHYTAGFHWRYDARGPPALS